MNARFVAIAAVVFAFVAGPAGYLLGRRQVQTAPGAAVAEVSLQGQRGGAARKSAFKNPRAALERESDPLKRFQLAAGNMEAWVNAEPLDALEWLKRQQVSGRRNEVIRLALQQFAENDPKGAAAWAMAHLSGAELNNALIRIAEQWARTDGAAAAAWLNEQPTSGQRDAAMENMMFAWATQNPAAALDFIGKSNIDDEIAATLRNAAFAGWAKSDPQNAVAASLESSRKNDDPEQFANTLANWATMDLAASSEWLFANVREGGERDLAVQELAGIYAHESPAAGLAWLEKLKAGEERENARNTLATEWAAADAASAAKWAATLTPGSLNEQSTADILHGFLAQDAKAFETWRAALPDGPLKQQAARVGETGDEE